VADDSEFDTFGAVREVCASHSALSAIERLVALGIIHHVNRKSREAFPSLRALKDWTGLSKGAVWTARKSLCQGPGAIFDMDAASPRQSSRYRLRTDFTERLAWRRCHVARVSPSDTRGVSKKDRECQQETPRVPPGENRTAIERLVERRLNGETAPPSSAPVSASLFALDEKDDGNGAVSEAVVDPLAPETTVKVVGGEWTHGTRSSRAARKVRKAAPGWSAEGAQDWEAASNGTMEPGRIGKALKPLVDRHGWELVRPVLGRFLRTADRRFGPEYFAREFGRYAGGVATTSDATLEALDGFDADVEVHS
jgi:hypothetical protein